MAALADEHRYDVIVTTNGSTAGEKLSLRIIGDEKDYKIDDIGFTNAQLVLVREAMQSNHGLILLSAPPGEGLTTSVYSMTRSHDAFLQNIQTVEYEPDLMINNITQHSFVPSEEKTFTAELQRVMRTDPDVIVLPDLREKTAAPLATKAASHKQIVYVAIQAVDLFDGLRRWAVMVGDVKSLAGQSAAGDPSAARACSLQGLQDAVQTGSRDAAEDQHAGRPGAVSSAGGTVRQEGESCRLSKLPRRRLQRSNWDLQHARHRR